MGTVNHAGKPISSLLMGPEPKAFPVEVETPLELETRATLIRLGRFTFCCDPTKCKNALGSDERDQGERRRFCRKPGEG